MVIPMVASMWGANLHPKNTLVKSHRPQLPAVPNILQLQGVCVTRIFLQVLFLGGGLVVRLAHPVMLIAYS